MTGLYPIIRRVRRPLVVADDQQRPGAVVSTELRVAVPPVAEVVAVPVKAKRSHHAKRVQS